MVMLLVVLTLHFRKYIGEPAQLWAACRVNTHGLNIKTCCLEEEYSKINCKFDKQIHPGKGTLSTGKNVRV